MPTSALFARALRLVFDCLFPIECLGCGQSDFWICPKCLRRIKPFPNIKPAGIHCPDVGQVIIASDYRDPLVQRAIHTLKYRYVRDLAVPLTDILVQHLPAKIFDRQSVLVPVPLHRQRLIERGFNQSALLAREIGRRLRLPVAEGILSRSRYTKSQMQLDRAARLHNVHGAFRLADIAAVRGKQACLVDDVLTTGSTLQDCARALKSAHPKQIIALVIAHRAD